MPSRLALLKKYTPSVLLVIILIAQTLSLLFLYFRVQDLQRNAELSPPAPTPTYSPLTPTPRASTLKDLISQGALEQSRSATQSGGKSLCHCPPGPPGAAGEKGEKGDKGDKGDTGGGDLTGGRWATYCQSKLGPVRQRPNYGCDTGNANADYKESEFQVWVK